MIKDFYKNKLQKDFDRIRILHWGHFVFVLISILMESFSANTPIWGVSKILLALYVYKLYFKIIDELYYTFWTFSTFLFFYLVFQIYQSIFIYEMAGLFYTSLLAMIFLLSEVYILSSPIYYPQVSWWEYDFRYREDQKIKVLISSGSEVNGRLTDLRRGAGGIQVFEDIAVGDFIQLNVVSDSTTLSFKAEIMSKRQYSIGRPWTYGLKFHLESESEIDQFEGFCHFWKKERKTKKKMKFSKVGLEE